MISIWERRVVALQFVSLAHHFAIPQPSRQLAQNGFGSFTPEPSSELASERPRAQRVDASHRFATLEAGELAELHFTLANVIQSTSFHNMSYQFEKKLATSPGPTFRTCPHPPKGKGLRRTVQPVNYAPYIPMRLVRVPAVAKKVAA